MNQELSFQQKLRALPAQPPALRPLPLAGSLLLFFIPAGLVAFFFYIFRPWLERLGYDPLTSFLASLTVPTALLFAAALIGYHKVDGYPLTRASFAERMRFPRLRFRDALLGLGIFVLATLGYGLLSQATAALIRAGVIVLPSNLPVLVDLRAPLGLSSLNQAAGGLIRGRWDLAALVVVMYFFNIAGEELWWRGYILPRQELIHGKAAWLVNGLLWNLFHLFKYWDLPGLLAVCLLIPLAAQRTKSTWPGLIAHALMNASAPLLVLAAVAGVIK